MRYFVFLLKLILVIVVGLCAGGVTAVYFHFSSQVPELDSAVYYEPAISSKVYDRHGRLLAEFAREKRIIIPLSDVPMVMRNAIISVEDEHFYSHNGLDLPGIARAAWKNYQAGEVVQGGSTITQQLAKSLFLTRERTLQRKIKEALLAYRLEEELTKNRILELYLNQVYFGSGAYGIESAARRYFSKSASQLNLKESALLAGLPKAPSRFSPLRNPDQTLSRRNLVLMRMAENGFITSENARKLSREDLGINPGTGTKIEAPYFVEVIRRELEQEFGADILYMSGLQIITTLDLEFQKVAEDAVQWGLHEVEKRRPWRGPISDLKLAVSPPEIGDPAGVEITEVGRDRLKLNIAGIEHEILFKDIWVKNRDLKKLIPGDRVWCIVDEYKEEGETPDIVHCRITQEPEVEGSLVALDPNNGEILAWVGGYDFFRSQFDRVSQSKRQPGSAFKPIIYAKALDEKYSASDVIYDTPIVIEKTWGKETKDEQVSADSNPEDGDEVEYWKPHNYSEEFYGATTIREGLTLSRNIISIHLLDNIGVKNVIQMARRLGIKSPLTNSLSLALGASELTLLEITQAYGSFATLGVRAKPLKLKMILDRNDRVIREYYPSLRRSIRATTAYLITYLMQGVIQHGTGISARRLNRPLGGKTGTTNNYHDAWFVGFTPDVVTGVWVGLDQLQTISKRATGASTALPIWLRFMEKILESYEVKDFEIPPGITHLRVCRKSGLVAISDCEKTILEAYTEGTEPLSECDQCGNANQILNTRSLDWNWDSPVEPTQTPSPEVTPGTPESSEVEAGATSSPSIEDSSASPVTN